MITATFLNKKITFQKEFEYTDDKTQEKKKAISFGINDKIEGTIKEKDGSYAPYKIYVPVYVRIYDEKMIEYFKQYYNATKDNLITLVNIQISSAEAIQVYQKDKDGNKVYDNNGNAYLKPAIVSYSATLTKLQQIIINYQDKKVNDNTEVDVVIDDEVSF